MAASIITNEVLVNILEHFRTAVYIVNKAGRLVYLNNAAAKMDNLIKNKVIGKKLTCIYKKTVFQKNMNSPCLSTLEDGIPHVNENLEWFLEDGTMINAITSTYPIEKNGEIKGVFALSENIDGLKSYLIKQGAYKRKKSYRFRNKTMKNGTQYIFNDIIGSSETIEKTIMMARRFASKKLPVMIYGETGTGKEMFAQSIHNASKYVAGPFVPINCAAIPENLLESILFGTAKGAFTGSLDNPGLFEKARNGSIFLDEINSMPITLQAKLLRVLQEKEVQRIGDSKTRKVDCRIISATNKLISDAISDGELREDLFYRLCAGMVWIPSLKKRSGDIDRLVEFFIDKTNEEINATIIGVSRDLHKLLHTYDWPGNIRELSNIIESTMNMTEEGDTILDIQHLPTYLKKRLSYELLPARNAEQAFFTENEEQHNTPPPISFKCDINIMVDDYERKLIEFALKSTKGNLTKCGKKLGISRQSLRVKTKKYNIDITKFKSCIH